MPTERPRSGRRRHAHSGTVQGRLDALLKRVANATITALVAFRNQARAAHTSATLPRSFSRERGQVDRPA
jgi:hypothetical protein